VLNALRCNEQQRPFADGTIIIIIIIIIIAFPFCGLLLDEFFSHLCAVSLIRLMFIVLKDYK
jgi:flagellar biosynthesis component FlhA